MRIFGDRIGPQTAPAMGRMSINDHTRPARSIHMPPCNRFQEAQNPPARTARDAAKAKLLVSNTVLEPGARTQAIAHSRQRGIYRETLVLACIIEDILSLG